MPAKTGGNIRGLWTVRKCRNRMAKINPERCRLIHKQVYGQKMTPDETARLAELQTEADELLSFMDAELMLPVPALEKLLRKDE